MHLSFGITPVPRPRTSVRGPGPARWFALLVGFSDNRRLDLAVRFVVAVVFLLGIIIVGISGRDLCCPHDGDEVPVDQRTGHVLSDARGHVGLLLGVATFRW